MPAGWECIAGEHASCAGACALPHIAHPSHTPALRLAPCPAQDKFLKFKYDAETVEAGKAYAKAELQKEAGLPVDPKVGGQTGGLLYSRILP